MKKDGKSIIIITHKLNEVLEISDRVSVLRKGKYIGTVETKDATTSSLTEMMVGEKITLDIKRTDPVNVADRLVCKGISCKSIDGLPVLSDINFTARAGEILGIAGISGNGQRELLESICGLEKYEGEISFIKDDNSACDMSDMDVAQIRELGIRLAFIPEDRLGMGLVASMDLTDNVMLRSYLNGHGLEVDRKSPRKLAKKIVKDLEVVTPSVDTQISRLSGGNVQKVLVGREISGKPKVLLVAYPVRGLDINSSYLIYNLLNKQKENGCAVICVIEDLDVLLALSDRILVLAGGRCAGLVDARSATKEEIGLMMTGDVSMGGEKNE